MYPKIQEYIIDEILFWYPKGESIESLSKRLNLTSSNVKRLLVKYGGYSFTKKVLFLERNQIINEFKNGTTIKNIALKFKRCQPTIKKILYEEKLISKQIPQSIPKEAIDQYVEGKAIVDIARSFGITSNVLNHHITRNNIRIRRNIVSKENIEEMTELYKSGLSIEEISERMNFSYSTINKHLGKQNFKRNRSTKVTEVDVKNIIKMKKSGMSMVKISEITGFAQTTIKRHLTKNGISVKKYHMNGLEIFEILDMLSKGISIKRIAKKTGRCEATIIDLAKGKKHQNVRNLYVQSNNDFRAARRKRILSKNNRKK